MRKWVLVLLFGVFCAGVGVALARSTSAVSMNPSATRAYLIARNELQEAIDGGDVARASAVHAFVERINDECPNVLAAAPGVGGVLRREAVSQLEYTRLSALRPAYLSFARAISKLRWSSGGLTQLVHRQAKVATATVSGVRPNICTDAREFVTSEYRVEPEETKRFLAERTTVENDNWVGQAGSRPLALGAEITDMLRRYVRPSDRALLAPKPPSPATERTFLVGLDEIVHALGLPKE